jgi:hypothetical protein
MKKTNQWRALVHAMNKNNAAADKAARRCLKKPVGTTPHPVVARHCHPGRIKHHPSDRTVAVPRLIR